MYEGEMIPTRNDDDEPDVIDLTTCPGYYGYLDCPIRPPTPFADNSIWPPIVSGDNDTNEVITWSSSEQQSSLDYKTDNNENIVLSSSHTSSSPSSRRTHNTWRRKLSNFLKRTKSNEHRTVISSTKSDDIQPYNFDSSEIIQTNSSISRNSGKRVHWIDDDEIVLNLSHRFIEYLKLFVQNIIDNNNNNEDTYLINCQISLDELDSLIDCQEIKEAFEDIIELTKTRNKNLLLEQQTYIENLLSRTVHLSST